MQFSFQKSKIKSYIRRAAIFVPIATGSGLAIYDGLDLREGLASKDWIPAQGKMLSNSVKAERPWLQKMEFTPTVSYSYHLSDDIALRGDRMTFPDHVAAPETELKKLLERIEVGHPVTAYYDPKNVSHVTMIRGVRRAKYTSLFVRDAVIALAGALFWLSRLLPGARKVKS